LVARRDNRVRIGETFTTQIKGVGRSELGQQGDRDNDKVARG